MSMQEERNAGHQLVNFKSSRMEEILLTLADAYKIQIVWDGKTALITGVCMLAGGVLGGYNGGKMGAAIGASIGGVTGYGVARLVSLRDIWGTVKEQLTELLFIVFNFLRRLDLDYATAIDILMTCTSSRRELVYTIIAFIAERLGKEVISSLTAA
ncbi:uncharacterized protein LOC106135317 [Amyelois transitella]|uniref:uncharacterized protein LOC106135317 n=1 Tax=Amyelois transitella TaxID=680683 RepID=UPI00298F8A7F|nr:uncharacterized protein LOC106135317 [Amyelois transitella]